MVLITGDTHGAFARLRLVGAAAQRELTRDDYIIICGDFGGIWSGDAKEQKALDELAALPYNILFADGNHENYDLLNSYGISTWHGGKVHFIRDNLIHLMRGQIYEIGGSTFFVMGGAASHDIYDGVLDKDDPEFEKKLLDMQNSWKMFRVKGVSWWENEMPDASEMAEAWDNLKTHNFDVDYVISHCAPGCIQKDISAKLMNFSYKPDALTDFLDKVYAECRFREWYCGHYHRELEFGNLFVKYSNIKKLF